MSRIKDKFNELEIKNKKALITFLTAGDPNIEVSKKIIKEMEKRGADLIEIGIPYSDPIAEGSVIQEANKRALSNNIKICDIMNMVYDLRKELSIEVPLIYLLYFNCILQFGIDKFFKECNRVGIDGVIIPDLPFEEQDEIKDEFKEHGIDLITLVTPTSKERIRKISKNARGFLYCVSSLGVTGKRNNFKTDFNEFFSEINKYSKIPKALGFGISTPEHIRELKKYCDGLIVGTAIVRIISKSKSDFEIIQNVGEFVEKLKIAIDEK